MDLVKLTVSQLQDLLQQIPAEIKRRESEEKTNVLNELRALAKAKGYSIEDLLAKEVKVKAVGSKVKVKYRHPQNAELEVQPGVVASRSGLMPGWLKARPWKVCWFDLCVFC